MNEGFWINYQSDKTFPVQEHEQWVREPKNAKKLGLSPATIKSFSRFTPGQDRDKFLMFLMKQAPIMRVRGHGSYISFEFDTHNRQSALDSIWLFGKEYAGPFSTFYIVNFGTGEKLETSFQQFSDMMDSGGAEAVMRAASTFSIRPAISRELLRIAKEILG